MCDVAHSSTCIRVCDAPHSSPGRQCNSCALAVSRRYARLRSPVVSAVQHFYVGNQTGLRVATARDRGFARRRFAGHVPPNRERGAGSGTLRCRVSSGTGGTLGSWSSCLHPGRILPEGTPRLVPLALVVACGFLFIRGFPLSP